MSEVTRLGEIVKICSQAEVEKFFAPLITDLPLTCTKAEMVSACLNKELSNYGLKTYVSADKTSVFLDDKGMSKIIDFFQGTGYVPIITGDQAVRVGSLIQYANDNQVDLLWSSAGIKKGYYYFKQYGFNGLNLYNVLTLNTVNYAQASLSSTGAVALTMTGVVALSWTGSLFFSTLENYIPMSMPRVKLVVSGIKFTTALPIRLVEWTSNQIFGTIETVIIGNALPTNITEVFKLSSGPKLKDLSKLKQPVIKWLKNQLDKW